MSAPRHVSVAVALLLPTSTVTVSFAQTAAGGGAAGGAADTSGAAPAQAAAPASEPTLPMYPAPVAPAPPGAVLGGGNVGGSSSSRPKSGDEEDHFDLGPAAGSGASVHGEENGPVFLDSGNGGERIRPAVVPNTHVVRKGDTLWDLCDLYFQNPYQWPRVWSYNPQLQNPHWIYPGDQIRLRSAGEAAALPTTPTAQAAGPSLIDRRRHVPNDTVFLRDQGFVDDKAEQDWGEISGAPVDKMFLSDFDEVYLRVGGNRDVKLGQELTVFRDVRSVPGGKLVQIQGTVKVDEWNPKTRIARGQIVESLDVMERGARVGPIERKFVIVPPKRNENDVHAKVLASVHQHTFYGQNQVVFVDKGEKDGLVPGNRLFIVRKGDAWRQSLATSAAATRIALESDSPAAVEKVPTPRDPKALPEEVIGELRVVSTREHSAACIVSQSRREIELDDDAIARKGY